MDFSDLSVIVGVLYVPFTFTGASTYFIFKNFNDFYSGSVQLAESTRQSVSSTP